MKDIDCDNNATLIKQVIVMRKDLKMRRGKEIAQGAHAAMQFLLYQDSENILTTYTGLCDVESAWLNGAYAKVTLQIDGEDALKEIHKQALQAGLESHIIEDSGHTEFHGQPTFTCLAIGPDLSEKIDPITQHLKCY